MIIIQSQFLSEITPSGENNNEIYNTLNKYLSKTSLLSNGIKAAIASLVYSSTPVKATFPILNLKLNNVVFLGMSFTFELLIASSVIFSFVSVITCLFSSETDTQLWLPLKYAGIALDGVPPIFISHTSPKVLNGYWLS